MVVYPGVTVHSKEEFDSRIQETRGVGDGLHIDVMDGVYVPNTLLSLDAMGVMPADRFCEAHLMVNNPRSYFEICKSAGFKKVMVHADALELDTYAEMLLVQDEVHAMGMQFCLVFKQGDSVDLHEDLCQFDQVLVMTVTPGFSGQEFIPEQVEEIRKIRAFCPDLPIEVDGHISDETIALVRDAGATAVVSTSYLSGTDIVTHLKTLKGE